MDNNLWCNKSMDNKSMDNSLWIIIILLFSLWIGPEGFANIKDWSNYFAYSYSVLAYM